MGKKVAVPGLGEGVQEMTAAVLELGATGRGMKGSALGREGEGLGNWDWLGEVARQGTAEVAGLRPHLFLPYPVEGSSEASLDRADESVRPA